MPNQQQNEPEQVSDKEKSLVVALQALDQRERAAYRYFCDKKQAPVSLEKSDEMFQFFLQGSTCEEIRRGNPALGLGQVVACRVQHSWDARREEYRKKLLTQVPSRSIQVHLEQVDFIADLLTISRHAIQTKIRDYMATGDVTKLEGLPIPKSTKEYRELLDLFIRSTGQDKKRIEVSGNVTVDQKTGTATTMTAAAADAIMDEILGEKEEEEPPSPPSAKVLAPVPSSPKTPEEMVAFLVKIGVSDTKAKALVESIGKDVKRYAELAIELSKNAPEDLN